MQHARVAVDARLHVHRDDRVGHVLDGRRVRSEIDSIRFDSTRFDSIRFDSIRFDSPPRHRASPFLESHHTPAHAHARPVDSFDCRPPPTMREIGVYDDWNGRSIIARVCPPRVVLAAPPGVRHRVRARATPRYALMGLLCLKRLRDRKMAVYRTLLLQVVVTRGRHSVACDDGDHNGTQPAFVVGVAIAASSSSMSSRRRSVVVLQIVGSYLPPDVACRACDGDGRVSHTRATRRGFVSCGAWHGRRVGRDIRFARCTNNCVLTVPTAPPSRAPHGRCCVRRPRFASPSPTARLISMSDARQHRRESSGATATGDGVRHRAASAAGRGGGEGGRLGRGASLGDSS